jgi:FkbM family methyltransferase
MYEPQETAILKSILKPGMTFVDVGANWGYFTLLAAQATSPGGRVLSLEPDPRLYAVLRENLALNGCTRVTALQLAAAEESGVLALAGFDESGDNWGLSRLVGNSTQNGPQYQVATAPLDDVLAEYGLASVDLLKMDIEGAEALALPGLQDTLARKGIRRLLLELHPGLLPNFSSDAAALIGLIQKHGYHVLTIDHSSAALRQAAYERHPDPAQFLSPFIPGDSIDDWPHLLCVAPGVTPF